MALVLQECSRCKNTIPLDWSHCPHCGGYQNCPNVVMARQPAEQKALQERVDNARVAAIARGARDQLDAFERQLSVSQAVMGSTLAKLKPIVNQERDVFATFHELAELRFYRETPSTSPNWNTVRPIAEIALLGGPKQINQLHYAALSLDANSLPWYGECTVILKEEMIAHRASLFQENSAVYVDRNAPELPVGSRSIWDERGKLCTAKLAHRIMPSTKVDEFSELLLKQGPTGVDDEFVEVQIFGPMTFRTFERLKIAKAGAKPAARKRPRKRTGTPDERATLEYCRLNSVECELI